MTATLVDRDAAIEACGHASWHIEQASQMLVLPSVAVCSVSFMDSQIAIDAADKVAAASLAVAKLQHEFERHA